MKIGSRDLAASNVVCHSYLIEIGLCFQRYEIWKRITNILFLVADWISFVPLYIIISRHRIIEANHLSSVWFIARLMGRMNSVRTHANLISHHDLSDQYTIPTTRLYPENCSPSFLALPSILSSTTSGSCVNTDAKKNYSAIRSYLHG